MVLNGILQVLSTAGLARALAVGNGERLQGATARAQSQRVLPLSELPL